MATIFFLVIIHFFNGGFYSPLLLYRRSCLDDRYLVDYLYFTGPKSFATLPEKSLLGWSVFRMNLPPVLCVTTGKKKISSRGNTFFPLTSRAALEQRCSLGRGGLLPFLPRLRSESSQPTSDRTYIDDGNIDLRQQPWRRTRSTRQRQPRSDTILGSGLDLLRRR